jgi:hypothetical protein
VESVLRGGQRARGADKRAPGVTAYQLLGGEVDTPAPSPEVDLPEAFLDDLYVHPLIITPDYVGADRRTSAARHRRDRGGHGPSLRAVEILVIVVATMSVAVPLTLMASHAAVAGTSTHPLTASPPSPPRTVGALPPGRSAAGPGRRVARAAARARLARQRAERRAVARQANASRQHAARAARLRRQEAMRHAARIRRLERVARARARRR